MKHELIVIWETGKKEVHEYENQFLAEVAAKDYKMTFGNQILWMGMRKAIEKELFPPRTPLTKEEKKYYKNDVYFMERR